MSGIQNDNFDKYSISDGSERESSKSLKFYPSDSFSLSPTFHTFVKLFARDVFALESYSHLYGKLNVWFFRNYPIRWVHLCGIVSEISFKAAYLEITLDDSSDAVVDLRITVPEIIKRAEPNDDYEELCYEFNCNKLYRTPYGWQKRRSNEVNNNESGNEEAINLKTDKCFNEDQRGVSKAHSIPKTDGADAPESLPIRIGQFASAAGELVKRGERVFVNVSHFFIHESPLSELDAWVERLMLRKKMLSVDWQCNEEVISDLILKH